MGSVAIGSELWGECTNWAWTGVVLWSGLRNARCVYANSITRTTATGRDIVAFPTALERCNGGPLREAGTFIHGGHIRA